jgi:hypothetical protein
MLTNYLANTPHVGTAFALSIAVPTSFAFAHVVTRWLPKVLTGGRCVCEGYDPTALSYRPLTAFNLIKPTAKMLQCFAAYATAYAINNAAAFSSLQQPSASWLHRIRKVGFKLRGLSGGVNYAD